MEPAETASISILHEPCEGETEARRARLRLTVGDAVLGNFEAEQELSPLLSGVQVVLRHAGNRRNDELFALPLERLFRHLQIGLFVYADPGLDGGSDWQRYLRFVAVPQETLAFASWTVFIVENAQLGRVVWQAPGAVSPQQAFVEAGDWDAAMQGFEHELAASLAARRSIAPASGERLKGKLRDVG